MKPVSKILPICLSIFGFACGGGQTERTGEMPEAQSMGPNVQGQEVVYELDQVKMTGYLAYDANQEGPRPGVIVVHEWWGPTDYVRRRADMLAEMGYTALALDMYGDGKIADHPDDAQTFMTEVVENLDVGVQRFNEAQRLLEQHPTTDSTKTAAIGYCFGGGVVLHMARIGADLDGVASFHGSLASEVQAESGKTTAAILVANGADDPWITEEHIAAFEQEMVDAGVDVTFFNYEGAVHGFTNPAATERGLAFDLPLAYNAAADSASWAELETFLGEIF